MAYLLLYLEFCKIGLFAVGGGLATLPFLYRLAASSAWLSVSEIPSMLAVVQMLPGAIGVNLSAYAGTRFSPLGAIPAVLGLLTPQVVIITLIARMFQSFNTNKTVKRLFAALQPAAAGLLAAAAFQLVTIALLSPAPAGGALLERVNIRETLLFAGVFILIRLFRKVHPALFIAAAGAAGAALGL
jgi:chromate transporter